MSAEATVVRNYLDWLLSNVPWGVKAQSQDSRPNLKLAEKMS